MRDLTEKLVEFTVEAREVGGGKVDECTEDSRKKRERWITDCERESKIVCDGDKLFGDNEEIFQASIVVVEEFEGTFPTLIW